MTGRTPRRQHSLTLRLAVVFAALSFACFACLGVALYDGLERELVRRDDAALINRIEQLRTFLDDSNTLELIRSKPTLFENMLGNREALLTIGVPGEPPLLVVNPGHLDIPAPTPLVHVTPDRPLVLSDVSHQASVKGVPFSSLATVVASNDMGPLQLVTGRLMTERTEILRHYRLSVYALASLAAIAVALLGYLSVKRGLLVLRRLAQHAHSIGIGNLDQRLSVQGVPRELLPMVEAFNTMLDRLAKGFSQLGQVSTDMAHELRTPINNLLGETLVALQQNRGIEDYQQLLASNVEELERLGRMLDNMLFLARTDPASAMQQGQVLSMAQEARRIADYFEGPAADRGMHIEAEADCTIWANPILLRRALANLCANAIKYGAADSTLSIQARPSPGGTTLSVTNHGTTIAAEHLPKLFDRFYRADPSRERSADSNGLGLSIVATIMQLHKGRYTVTSAEGITCFELFFPAPAPEVIRV